jgi:cephalosporin hydroxylase
MKRLWYRFIQWLWFGRSLLPEHPRYTVRKTKGFAPTQLQRSDKAIFDGVSFFEPWNRMKDRFLSRWVVRYFCRYYHRSNAWALSHWRNVPCYKNPCDLMVYQEIVTKNKPDIIIECGTFFGGTTLFLADLCDSLDNGLVATLDIRSDVRLLNETGYRDQHRLLKNLPISCRPQHPRILYLIGCDDTDPDILEFLTTYINSDTKVMVILDSSHRYKHVKKQLELYAPLVTPGQYLIVEDTNAGWQVKKDLFTHGPLKAVREFMQDNDEFYVDYEKERHMLTMNPCGYLRKIPK